MPDNCVFAINFTFDHMTAAFVTPDGEEEGSAGFDLCDFMAGESDPLDKLVTLLAAKARAGSGRCDMAAVCVPCDVDVRRERILSFPQAPWLNAQPLPEILEKALGMPVIMERRAIVLLACDLALLGLPADSLVVGSYVDDHYDSAIWHCGRPLYGRNGTAGNIAHMAIHGREDNCFCGKVGCVDLYGAGGRLKQIHNMIFPDTKLEEIFTHHREHPLIRDYLTMMAYPLAIEYNLIDPDFMIIGGSIPAMRDFPDELLKAEVKNHSYLSDTVRSSTFLSSIASTLSEATCVALYARQTFTS